MCSAAGMCGGGASLASCPNGNVCSMDNVTCQTACGSVGGAGANFNAPCQSGYYCDGVGAGACHPQKAVGASCMQPYECAAKPCASGVCPP
jgi:hypothetical protein